MCYLLDDYHWIFPQETSSSGAFTIIFDCFRTFLDGTTVVVQIAQQQEPRSACHGQTPPPCLRQIAAVMVHLFSSKAEYNWWGPAGSSVSILIPESSRRCRVQDDVLNWDFKVANQSLSGKTAQSLFSSMILAHCQTVLSWQCIVVLWGLCNTTCIATPQGAWG